MQIRLPPYFYDDSIEILEYLIKKYGFEEINSALWQMVDIKNHKSQTDYEESLRHSARKILKKTFLADVSLKEIAQTDHSSISHAYDLINENRNKNNTALKYSKNYLMKLISAFGTKIKIFTLQIDSNIVAAAICHKTAENIMYVASWGDYGHDLKFSPMYKFSSELVRYSIKKNYEYLDFGLSCDRDVENSNLLHFKKNIGCKTTSQRTFMLSLNS